MSRYSYFTKEEALVRISLNANMVLNFLWTNLVKIDLDWTESSFHSMPFDSDNYGSFWAVLDQGPLTMNQLMLTESGHCSVCRFSSRINWSILILITMVQPSAMRFFSECKTTMNKTRQLVQHDLTKYDWVDMHSSRNYFWF